MQRGATHRHRPRDHVARALIGDEVAGPLVLAVVETALPVLEPLLDVEESLAGFDDDDLPGRTELGELLRHHGGGDAAADDQDITLVARHYKSAGSEDPASDEPVRRSDSGSRSDPSRPRHVSRPIAALYAMSYPAGLL